jgi:imidazolonepropionase-like amidohydrolase
MKGGNVVKQGPPPAAPPSKLALRAAHLFDSEKGALVDGATVLIDGDRIVAAGLSHEVQIPPDAQMIDLGDATLLPGLIDAHVHITGEAQEDYNRTFVERILQFPSEETLRARLYARRTLLAGFTTVRNLGAHGRTDLALRNAIDKGLAEGPRLIVSGDGIGSRGGHADSSPAPPWHLTPRTVENGICSGADQCRDAVRWQLKYGADVIKFMVSGGVLSPGDPVDVPQLTADETAAIIDEAHAWQKKAAAHCHGDAAAKIAVAAGVDSIEHGSLLEPDTLAEMKRRGVVYVPTLMAFEEVERKAKENKFPPLIAQKALAAAASLQSAFQAAVKLGVTIGLGTDSGVSRHGKNAREVLLMVRNAQQRAAGSRRRGARLASDQGRPHRL